MANEQLSAADRVTDLNEDVPPDFDYEEGVAQSTLFPADIVLDLFGIGQAAKAARVYKNAVSLKNPAFSQTGKLSRFSPYNYPYIGTKGKDLMSKWDPRRWGSSVLRGVIWPHATRSYTPQLAQKIVEPINSIMHNLPPHITTATAAAISIVKYFEDNPDMLTTEADEAVSKQLIKRYEDEQEVPHELHGPGY